MKISIGLSLTFALFFCLVKCEETKSLNSDPTSASKEDDRQGLIEDAVRSFLGVKELSEMGSNFRRRSPPTPPRYMLDLYDRYRTGQTQSKGNTVRSILPMRGSLEGVEMLVFNLTGIHSEEQILQSRLHIYKRRRPRGGGGGGGRKREVNRLKVTDLSMVSPPRWLDVPRQKNGGWQSFDMTEAVIQCRGAQHNGHYLLGVSAESRRPNGRYRAVPMRRVARMNSQPFLIVFSEDRNNKTNVSSEQQRDSTNYHELRDIWLRSRNGSEQMIPQNTSSLPRIKRAILSNELPYYSLRINSLSGKSYGLLSKTQYRKTYSRILPLPKDPKQSTKLPKLLQKPKKSKRKNRKLPFWWARQDGRRLEATAKGLLCQRRSLIVDFSQIGWGDWIISPKSFDSHYCAGSCNFPLTQNMKPSNHATIQSLVHALKMDPEVPSPCCVPYSTSSLTLLYIDENKNVVLKNYPNMIVESCACR